MINNSDGKKVLVTGASGFLGRRIVEILVEKGCRVHAFVRKTSRIDHLHLPHVKIFYGDISDKQSLEPVFEGIDYVVHAAADTSGSEAGRLSTIQGARNILELCDLFGVKKLVYISSCSVYGKADYQLQQLVDENASLERFPELRGSYSQGKLESEKVVMEFMAHGKTPVVCLRPGTIYGIGAEIYTPMMGFSLGNKVFMVIDNGDFVLPLVYIDNLVEAILVSMENEKSGGQIYNIVDPDRVNKKRYMELLIRKMYPQAKVLYLPYNLLYYVVLIQEKVSKALRLKPVVTCYRLISSQNPVIYDASKIMDELGWEPTFSFEKAVKDIIKQ